MLKKTKFCVCVWIFSVLFSLLSASENEIFIPKWKIGDTWEVYVTSYYRGWALAFSDPELEAKKNEPVIQGEYTVTIEIFGEDNLDNLECWIIRYSTDDKAPRFFKNLNYKSYISKKTGSIIKILEVNNTIETDTNPSIDDYYGIILDSQIYNVPIKAIPWIFKKEKDKKSRFDIILTKKINTQEKKLLLTIKDSIDDEIYSTLSQTWKDGDNWWSEYEETIQGHIEMKAVLKKYYNKFKK